jgi:hypothetical protein
MMEAHKWKPGESGNRSGRPKRKPVTEMYEAMLSDPKLVAKLKGSIEKALTRGQMAMVLQLKEMTDRVEGKVTQPIEAEVNVNLAETIAAARKRANGPTVFKPAKGMARRSAARSFRLMLFIR